MYPKLIKSVRDLPAEEVMQPGTPACAGCPATLGLRLALKVLGPDTVIVNPAGCMTLLVVYPYTPLNCGWMHLAFENAGAGASGIKNALTALGKGDTNVIAFAGDGGTYDIGLQSLSAAIDRGEKITYICYDNEAYGNTGFQKSGATPYGSHTTTTPPGAAIPQGHQGRKKDMYEIIKAHNIDYVATASIAHPFDYMQKVYKAAQNNKTGGSSFILLFAPCPTGWGFDAAHTIELGRLAVQSGTWVLKEFDHGVERVTMNVQNRTPVEKYLEKQGRFGHLFKPAKQQDVLDKIQKGVDDHWEKLKARGLLG